MPTTLIEKTIKGLKKDKLIDLHHSFKTRYDGGRALPAPCQDPTDRESL